jgi:hypothetical protein
MGRPGVRSAPSINLTGSEPKLQINGAASQAVFRGGPTQTTSEGKTTYSYDLIRGLLTADGEKVFAGFYPAPNNNGFGCVSASFTLP